MREGNWVSYAFKIVRATAEGDGGKCAGGLPLEF